jgi:hypothetical protein
MLCSNDGEARATPEGVSFTVRQGRHEIFTDPDTALRHARWLVGMKQRFAAEKRELLSLCKPYRDLGEWIEPE